MVPFDFAQGDKWERVKRRIVNGNRLKIRRYIFSDYT